MEYGEKFKKSVFGGFDRQDVLRCLDEMQRESHREQEKLKEELEAFRRLREELTQTVSQREEELEALRIQLEEAQAALEETKAALAEREEELSAAREETAQSESRCEELQRDLSAQKALNTELLMKKNVMEENCRRLTAQNQELAGRIDERMSLEIGELMIEAQQSANRIVERAAQRSAETDALIAGQCEEAGSQIAQLQSRLGQVMDAFQKMSAAAVRNMEQISTQLTQCQQMLTEQAKPQPVDTTKKQPAKEAPASQPAEKPTPGASAPGASTAGSAPSGGNTSGNGRKSIDTLFRK